MTRNNLDNPIFLFIVLIMAITVNIISSIHFLLITFAGILFTAFYRCLRKRYLYSLTFVVIAFLFIEINTGLKPFTLTLLSQIDIDKEIPASMYKAVAEIFSFIYELSNNQNNLDQKLKEKSSNKV